jgi:hypothetical protein
MPEPVYFAQITDAHVGSEGLNPQEAACNLRWALAEIAAFRPAVEAGLVTADLVCAGRRAELAEWGALVAGAKVPLHALPANHDLWGEPDGAAWRDLIGPLRQRVDLGGLAILLWDDLLRTSDGGWQARLGDEQSEWLAAELAAATGSVIVAHHAPILPIGDTFHDTWAGSNAPDALALFQGHGVIATITGHWHRNGEWFAEGLRVINSGSLAGWQWNGIPPHWCFPTRPGYRLFCHDGGALRTCWREGSYWQTPAPEVQVALEWIGPAHTGGPRPQVRAPLVSGQARLVAKAFALGSAVERVEWSPRRGEWRPMQRVFHGLWSEWEAELAANEFRPGGPYPLAVRAAAGNHEAYDGVPVITSERDSGASFAPAALPGVDQVWEMFYPPG